MNSTAFVTGNRRSVSRSTRRNSRSRRRAPIGRGAAVPSVGVYQSSVSSTPQPSRQKLRSGVSRSKNRSIGPCQLLVEQRHRRVDVGERQPDLRAQVPAVREAHRAGAEHEPAVALDHQHEVLGNEARGGVERMQRRVEYRRRRSDRASARRRWSSSASATCCDSSSTPSSAANTVDRMLGVEARLGGDRGVGIGAEFDPVAQVERPHAEPPPERFLIERRAVPPGTAGTAPRRRSSPHRSCPNAIEPPHRRPHAHRRSERRCVGFPRRRTRSDATGSRRVRSVRGRPVRARRGSTYCRIHDHELPAESTTS